MKNDQNIILNTDSYKVSMWKQYPPQTEIVYTYAESRGGVFPKTVFFGLQAFIRQYLMKPITREDINLGDEMWTAHGLPFNREGWEYILREHGGWLPVTVRAVEEGEIVPVKVPLVTIENTDPECFWLTTWLETALLRAIWYPTTVATQSNYMRNIILEGLETSGDPESIGFKLHDFGARGATSMESAAIGGAAHLVNFDGTDTMSGALFARNFYGANMAGFSIPAAEHSTMTSWGREGEEDAYRNMLTQFAPGSPLIAVVSDSYDIFNAADNIWGDALRQEVIDSGSMIVIRPDSGDAKAVIMRLLEILEKRFGTTTNDKGYKVLNNVRLLQGDGVERDDIATIIDLMLSRKWSLDNLAFGMGGGLLQKVDRDTQKFAIKCSAIRLNGRWIDVKKDPITDKGKVSKAGRVVAARIDGELVSALEGDVDPKDIAMNVIYSNGFLKRLTTFDEVRSRARS